MGIVVTGADGFIGRNLCLRLHERGDRVLRVTRRTSDADRRAALADARVVIHLAGVNRPRDAAEFEAVNAGFTSRLCADLLALRRPVPLILASTSQATKDNAYGRSKRAAEAAVLAYAASAGANVAILRLWNVFGKWARPNYNSVVATFCHNLARGLPIRIDDPDAPLTLVHVDDVVDAMIGLVDSHVVPGGFVDVGPLHRTTVGQLAAAIEQIAASRGTRAVGNVGEGFLRVLYSTFVSYWPPEDFAYDLDRHDDARGGFAEVLRTPAAGQFSVFTARPGVTRGGHYHHVKTEKFVIVAGTARFRFRHMATGETSEVVVRGGDWRVVETVPGWAHDVTNIGDGELVVLLWANEAFEPERPDTIPAQVVA